MSKSDSTASRSPRKLQTTLAQTVRKSADPTENTDSHFLSQSADGRDFHIGMFGKVKEPWTTFVVASAALGCVLYALLRGHTPLSATKSDESAVPVKEQHCQDEDQDRAVLAMDPKDRALHERFMREAIAMVNNAPHILHTAGPANLDSQLSISLADHVC